MESVQGTLEGHVADRLEAVSGSLAGACVGRLVAALEPGVGRTLAGGRSVAERVEAVARVLAEVVRGGDPGVWSARLLGELRGLVLALRQAGLRLPQVLEALGVVEEVLVEAMGEALASYPVPFEAGPAFRLVSRAQGALARLAAAAVAGPELEGPGSAEQVQELGRVLEHELRNPLGVAEGALQLLESERVELTPERRRAFLDLIARSLKRVREVVEEVRVLAGDLAEARRVPLRAVLAEVAARVADLARDRGVAVHVSPDVPDVEVDGVRLHLALSNLVGNAIKYSDPAKPERWVWIRCEGGSEGGGCTVVVADNGLGIGPEDRRRVFEPFFRAHPGRAEGTGLGLGIARQAVEQLGGRIWLESEPGRGTTVYVALPAASPS